MYVSAGAGAIRHTPSPVAPQQERQQHPECREDEIAQIQTLPQSCRWLEFSRLIEAADVCTPELRDTCFIALSRQIEHLPDERRAAAFDLLSGPPDTLDKARIEALVEQLPHLNDEQQLIKFDDLYGGMRFVNLSRQLEQQPQDQRWETFGQLLDEAVGSGRQRCAAYLEALGEQIPCLDEHHRRDAFDGIAGQIEQAVAAQQRGAQWVALARQIPHLGSKHRVDSFDVIVDQIVGLPTEAQRIAHLSMVIRQIGSFQNSWQSTVFFHTASKIAALGTEQRLVKKSCFALHNELKTQACRLPYACDPLTVEMVTAFLAARLNELSEPAPKPFTLPSSALKHIKELAELSREDPAAAAAAIIERYPDGGHAGGWIAGLMNRYPRAGAASLTAYLDLVDGLRADGHLTPDEVQSLLLPESKEERHLPISAAVASRWQSRAALPFMITLANATPDDGRDQVIARLNLEQSDQHHHQLKMQPKADFFKQVKRSIAGLPVGTQDTPALRLLAAQGLIPPKRELGKIAEGLPAAAPAAASLMPAMNGIATRIDDVMPAVLAQEAEEQKQNTEQEKARAAYQERWQAARSAQGAGQPSPAATLVAAISLQLRAQGAAVHASKQQSIAEHEQARAERRQSDEQSSGPQRNAAGSGALAAFMFASRYLTTVASVPLQTSRWVRQHEVAPCEAKRPLRSRTVSEMENLNRLEIAEMLWRAPAIADLPALSASVAAWTPGRQPAIAEHPDEKRRSRTQTK